VSDYIDIILKKIAKASSKERLTSDLMGRKGEDIVIT